MGVIAFMLLCGEKPFRTRRDTVACAWECRGEAWAAASEDSRDFVARLLVAEPRRRLTAEQASVRSLDTSLDASLVRC